MQIGVVFPQNDIGSDPALIRAYAQTAEGLGFTHILCYDHVLGANADRPGGWRGPYTHRDPFHEVLTLFAYLAGATSTIRFATGILILPQRQTALVAKQAATIDVLSGGRLRLGVALGWNEIEYIALSQDFSTRGKRIEAQVALLRKLWTEPLVTHEDAWHTIPDAGLNPLPVQQPIPLWFGGYADAALRRMARLGDGWMPGGGPLENQRERLDKLHGYLSEAGRDPAAFGIEPRIPYSLGADDPAAWQSFAAEWEAAGATHLSLITDREGLESPHDHIRAITTFAEAMGL